MKKPSLFVVDTEKEFQILINSLCPADNTEVRFYSSAMEIFSLLRKEKPVLMFLCLDISDLNDFVMHDLLKKANVDYSVPVYITYSQQSEKDLKKYEKLKYKAEGYCKKPVSKKELEQIMKKYLKMPEKEMDTPEVNELDEDDFSDENIDRLVRGQLVDVDAAADKKEASTDQMRNRSDSGILAETENKLMVEKEKDSRVVNKDIEAQMLSLKSQNEFLRAENKKLTDTLKRQKVDIEKDNQEYQQLKSEQDQKIEVMEALNREKLNLTQKTTEQRGQIQQLEEEKSILQQQVNEIYNQLTDKERELMAKNQEFEIELKKKVDEVLQETEERMLAESKQREEQFNYEVNRLKKEKDNIELSLHNEIEQLTDKSGQLESEKEELKRREDSLNRTISTLAEEKVVFSEKLDFYKKKMEDIAELLHQSLLLTKTGE
jgi:CheY-like chemotaxis protein/FtsZ-binding cell division protein ZapB